MTRYSYRPLRCERTEATVVAIFSPLLNVGVITEISGGFMTETEYCHAPLSDQPSITTTSQVREGVCQDGFDSLRSDVIQICQTPDVRPARDKKLRRHSLASIKAT